jgi:hypothetical protein
MLIVKMVDPEHSGKERRRNVPKKMEDIRKAVQQSGKSKSQAYAIAQATYKKMMKRKKKK